MRLQGEWLVGPYEYDQDTIKFTKIFKKWLIELAEKEGQHTRNEYWSVLDKWKMSIDWIAEDDFEDFIEDAAGVCADYIWRTHRMPPSFLHWYISRQGGSLASDYLKEFSKVFGRKRI